MLPAREERRRRLDTFRGLKQKPGYEPARAAPIRPARDEEPQASPRGSDTTAGGQPRGEKVLTDEQKKAAYGLFVQRVKENRAWLTERIPGIAFRPSSDRFVQATAVIGDMTLQSNVSINVLAEKGSAQEFFGSWEQRVDEAMLSGLKAQAVKDVLLGEA